MTAHGTMATTATTHSGTHPSVPVAVSVGSSTPAKRKAAIDATPTSAITTGTHIHWATRTV